MHHMAAFGSDAFDGSAGLATLPFIAEPVLRSVSNVLQLQEDWDLQASFIGGAAITQARINSASTRIRGFPQLIPMQAGSVGGSLPAINDMREQPLRLAARENVSVQVTNGGAVHTLGLLWLTPPNWGNNVNVRNLRWIRFTVSQVCVLFTWSQPGTIILDDTLEAGWYKVYGLATFQATALCSRLIFNNQVLRPGCLSVQTALQQPAKIFNAGMGEYGQFESITPPQMETIANASATISVTGWLLCGK